MGLPSPARSAAPAPSPDPLPAEIPVLSESTLRLQPSERDTDMRRKRPPAISFLLRMETVRRAMRVLSLLALDLVGVALAIFTALASKEVVVHGQFDATRAFEDMRQSLAFAYLVTALLFARSRLYAERAQRPGSTGILASLFQVACVALVFALVSGEHFQSYYIFWGSLAFALVYIS